MRAVKYVITGDLHFRSENPRSRKDDYKDSLLIKLYEVFQIANDNDAQAVIIPGDIFDSVNVGLPTIAKLGSFLRFCSENFGIKILAISGNHDLPAGNKGALERTPFGLLESFEIIQDIEDVQYEGSNVNITGYGFDFKTDTDEGAEQFISCDIVVPDPTYTTIHVVHSMLLNHTPINGMRHTLINDVETDADIIISGHYHDGFGIIRRKDGKLFINPGALCRLSASEAEMKRTVQVALLTVRSKTDFEAKLIPLQSAKPAEQVLDREAIVEEKEHQNWLETFFESLQEEGEAKFLEVIEIVDKIASMEKIAPSVKDEALRRISDAREKLGRVTA